VLHRVLDCGQFGSWEKLLDGDGREYGDTDALDVASSIAERWSSRSERSEVVVKRFVRLRPSATAMSTAKGPKTWLTPNAAQPNK